MLTIGTPNYLKVLRSDLTGRAQCAYTAVVSNFGPWRSKSYLIFSKIDLVRLIDHSSRILQSQGCTTSFLFTIAILQVVDRDFGYLSLSYGLLFAGLSIFYIS